MNIEDDDLPVLTEVLREGSGGPPRFEDHEARGRESGVASMDPRLDPLASADAGSPWPRALVIGSDPEHDDDVAGEAGDRSSGGRAASPRTADGNADSDSGTGSLGAVSASTMTVADPRRIDHRDHDVFLRTAPTDAEFTGSIDEPPLVVRPVVRGAGEGSDRSDRSDRSDEASSSGIGSDVPLVFRDRQAPATRDHDATFALQVRDNVLQELSARIDTELDARIAQSLHAELETALAHLQAGLRVELAEALRDVVGHAVDDAVRRLRPSARPDGS